MGRIVYGAKCLVQGETSIRGAKRPWGEKSLNPQLDSRTDSLALRAEYCIVACVHSTRYKYLVAIWCLCAIPRNLVLLELRHREFMENAAVQSLENQLHCRQETKELQQPICDLESRLAVTFSDIVARQNECKSLETECQKLMSSNDSDLTEKIARKRYYLYSYPCWKLI